MQYPGDRMVLMLGQHEVGAVFPPVAMDDPSIPWRWRFWLSRTGREGTARSEQAAKNALLAEAIEWLRKAGMK